MTGHDVAQIALLSLISANTIRKTLSGRKVRPETRARVFDACRELGIEVPQAAIDAGPTLRPMRARALSE